MQTVPAHTLSYFILIGSSVLVPFIALGTYLASGASLKKSLGISIGIAIWGLIMYLFCTDWQFRIGNPLTVWAIVIFNVIWPSIIVSLYRDFFVGSGLSLKWLTFTQATRFMGTLFILENFLGHTGTMFAYVSGFGDFMAAVIAVTILVQLFTGGQPNKATYYFLIIFGLLDFVVAYSLSFFSSSTSLQLLAIQEQHLMGLYPLAMLPYFLVPFATAYHILMHLSLKQQTV